MAVAHLAMGLLEEAGGVASGLQEGVEGGAYPQVLGPVVQEGAVVGGGPLE